VSMATAKGKSVLVSIILINSHIYSFVSVNIFWFYLHLNFYLCSIFQNLSAMNVRFVGVNKFM
jgi:hypothetical protein